MKALITLGSKTTHGGTVTEADSSFLVDGKAVHLEGMSHFCPLCKTTSKAISSGQGFMMVGTKTIIMASDKATCGAVFIPNQSLVVRDNGAGHGGNGANGLVSSLLNSTKLYSGKYQLLHEVTGEPIINAQYKITYDDGTIVEGVTDDQGYTSQLEEREQKNDVMIELVEGESW